jgi:hypothetical protein
MKVWSELLKKYYYNMLSLTNVIRVIGGLYLAAILKYVLLVTVRVAIKSNTIKRAVLCLQLLRVHC